jgi:hypothetical protein
MLIPLGILAASGAGVASDYELIATAFGTGSSGTITFSSIPATYKHLQVRYTAKNTLSNSFMLMRFNGITTNGAYRYHRLRGSGTVVSSSESGSTNAIEMDASMASSTTTGAVSAGVIDILDYASSSKNTTIRALYGQAGPANTIYLASGALFNTAAITSLSLITGANSFATTTRFSLYGIKG